MLSESRMVFVSDSTRKEVRAQGGIEIHNPQHAGPNGRNGTQKMGVVIARAGDGRFPQSRRGATARRGRRPSCGRPRVHAFAKQPAASPFPPSTRLISEGRIQTHAWPPRNTGSSPFRPFQRGGGSGRLMSTANVAIRQQRLARRNGKPRRGVRVNGGRVAYLAGRLQQARNLPRGADAYYRRSARERLTDLPICIGSLASAAKVSLAQDALPAGRGFHTWQSAPRGPEPLFPQHPSGDRRPTGFGGSTNETGKWSRANSCRSLRRRLDLHGCGGYCWCIPHTSLGRA